MADPDQRTSLLGSDTAQVARLFGTTEYRLTRVYRSNPHILNAARALLNMQEPIVLVRREGVKPELYESPDENLAKLAKHLLDTKGYMNVAIITKCLENAKTLGQRVNLPVVSEDKAEILRGTFIIPLSLCAGLEFDAVIVWNAADAQYALDSEADKRKLYVASTRAMHQLIFHKHPKTPSTLVVRLSADNLSCQLPYRGERNRVQFPRYADRCVHHAGVQGQPIRDAEDSGAVRSAGLRHRAV